MDSYNGKICTEVFQVRLEVADKFVIVFLLFGGAVRATVGESGSHDGHWQF